MSHLTTLVNRVLKLLEVKFGKDFPYFQKRLKHHIANIIEYTYFSREQITKEEVFKLVDLLEKIKS